MCRFFQQFGKNEGEKKPLISSSSVLGAELPVPAMYHSFWHHWKCCDIRMKSEKVAKLWLSRNHKILDSHKLPHCGFYSWLSELDHISGQDITPKFQLIILPQSLFYRILFPDSELLRTSFRPRHSFLNLAKKIQGGKGHGDWSFN